MSGYDKAIEIDKLPDGRYVVRVSSNKETPATYVVDNIRQVISLLQEKDTNKEKLIDD